MDVHVSPLYALYHYLVSEGERSVEARNRATAEAAGQVAEARHLRGAHGIWDVWEQSLASGVTIELQRAGHDNAAFGELYDLYLPRVHAFCRVHTDTREEAEDVMAQTFERALAAIERYEPRGVRFSSWLFRIAGNLITDRHRRRVIFRDNWPEFFDVK